MALDPTSIQPGASVYAHHVDAGNHTDLGQFVGVVEAILERGGVHYLLVRPALDHADALYLPLGAVRAAVGEQVHLRLSPEDLAGRAWHVPPGSA